MASHKHTLVKCSGITPTENCKITHSWFVKDITKEPQNKQLLNVHIRYYFKRKLVFKRLLCKKAYFLVKHMIIPSDIFNLAFFKNIMLSNSEWL